MPTTAELLAQRERWLPGYWRSFRPVNAGLAASAALASDTGEALEGSVSIGGAEGIWLTLLARGYGVDRALGESDESLRYRLRNVEQKVSKTAILASVNAILAAYTDEEAVMIEHWDAESYLDQSYCNQTTIYDQHNAFTIRVPRLGEDEGVSDFCDEAFADDDSYAGGASCHPAYITIMAEVERLRAAGVRWWLVVGLEDDEGGSDVAAMYPTLVFDHNPTGGDQTWPVWVPEGLRFVGAGHRATGNITAGGLSIVRDVDGVQVDQFEAGPFDMSGGLADTEIDDTTLLSATASDRDSPSGGAYWLVTVSNLNVGSASAKLAVHLSFEAIP